MKRVNLPLVIIESPFKAKTKKERDRNLAYARAAMRDSLHRGEAPFASHLLYTQEGVLDDDVAEQRRRGLNAGLAWKRVADLTVFYIDLGRSPGMWRALVYCMKHALPFDTRRLPSKVLDEVGVSIYEGGSAGTSPLRSQEKVGRERASPRRA